MKLTISRPYPRDNELNAFGDFHHLEIRLSRRRKSLPTQEEFVLVGEKTKKFLTQSEFNTCLRVFFFHTV